MKAMAKVEKMPGAAETVIGIGDIAEIGITTRDSITTLIITATAIRTIGLTYIHTLIVIIATLTITGGPGSA